jgi:outer membrane protein assembly factor BamB/predicted phosphodiesterase
MKLNTLSRFTLTILVLTAIPGCSKPESGNLKFAFLTDIHVTVGSANVTNLNLAVEEINLSDADMVIVTGDITNDGSDAELQLAKSILDKLTKPYLIIPGNHETNWSESAGLSIIELWGNDRFITEWNDFLLVGFSTGPYMKMGDGHVKQEDIQWLKTELSSRSNKGKKLLAFAHYPLADGLDNWTDVTAILNEYECLAVFCGHGHRLGLHNFDSIPGVMGRALLQPNPASVGYNIAEVRNDSLLVSEKIIGEPLRFPQIAIHLDNYDDISKLPVSPRPDYSINETYPDIVESFAWVDTASIFTGVCLAGDSMFVYGNSMGWLKAVKHTVNQSVWEVKFNGSVFSTPALGKDVVVFGATDGFIYGMNIHDGTIIWKVDCSTPVLASPIIEGNNVYIGGGNDAFYCINLATGEIIWKYAGIDGLIQGKPAISGNSVVFGAWDRHLYCLNSSTGELVWKWNNGKANRLFSPGNIVPVISNGKVFIVAPDRFMTAIDLKTGQEVWRTAKHQVRESMGISPDGREVFVKLMNDSIVSVSGTSRDFKTIWAIDAGIKYDHNPCPLIADNNLVVGATKNGLVTVIDRRNSSVAWMHKTGNSSVNHLLFDDAGSIWLSSIEGKIVRFSSASGRRIEDAGNRIP